MRYMVLSFSSFLPCFLFKKIYFFLFIFGCSRSLLLCSFFCSRSEQGLLSNTEWGLLWLQSTGSRACGLSRCLLGSRAWAQYLRHTGLVVLWHVGSSQIRVEPVSPTKAGGFFTTEPPGKLSCFFYPLTRQIFFEGLPWWSSG